MSAARVMCASRYEAEYCATLLNDQAAAAAHERMVSKLGARVEALGCGACPSLPTELIDPASPRQLGGTQV